MMKNPYAPNRRQAISTLLTFAALPAWGLNVQSGTVNAFPFYSGEDALSGLYSHHMQLLAQAFELESETLVKATLQLCANPAAFSAALPAAKIAWRRTLLAWQALSSPALGPVIERRSQRQIDFWPIRVNLLNKAILSAPKNLADMELVGTPAKGLPTIEWLLSAKPSDALCPYIVLVAQSIEVEARALRKDFDEMAMRDWTIDEDVARAAFAQWINQWLGGLERLRWMHIEQPVQKSLSARQGKHPEFARLSAVDNLAEWRMQWQSLYAQARLKPAQRILPPVPGVNLIPIEALLLGKGHIALSQRWAKALDTVDASILSLPINASLKDLLALTKTLKRLAALYQAEVVDALDVPLGFSDADGD